MDLIVLLLSLLSANKEGTLVSKYIRVDGRGYSLYSREIIIDEKKYDYALINEFLPSINEAILMNNDSVASKELNKLLLAYDNSSFSGVVQYFYNDDIPHMVKVKSHHLYFNKDTIYIAYNATVSFYSIDRDVSKQYLPIRAGYSAIKQKMIQFPLLLLTNTSSVKGVSKMFMSNSSLKKYTYKSMMVNLEE